MSRSVRSSVAESVHSLMDSMGDEEFLSASPFNPKNLELRRVQRDANNNRTAFQAEFCRIDSMAYSGRGIVEDNDHVAPVASPARPQPISLRAPPAIPSSDRPPVSKRILDDDVVNGHYSFGASVPSATRRRGSLREQRGNAPTATATRDQGATSAPPQASAALHVPAPPISPSRGAVAHRRPSLSSSHSNGDGSTGGSTRAPSAKDAAPYSPSSASAAFAPMSRIVMAPLSPTNASADSLTSAAAELGGGGHLASNAPHPPRPPRAPQTAAAAAVVGSPARLDLSGKSALADHHNHQTSHNTLPADRRRKADMVDWTTPRAPAQQQPSRAEAVSFTSPSLRGITTAPSASSQSSLPPLPTLNLQNSGRDGVSGALPPVQRRNSSPARVRRTSAGAAPTDIALNTSSSSSPPNINGGGNDNDRGGVRVRASGSGASTVPLTQTSPCSSPGRSSDASMSPAEKRRCNRHAVALVKAPASLQGTASNTSQLSAVPSVVTVTSSASSDCASASPQTTPAATPSATLRLMSAPEARAPERSPASRLNGAARVAVAANQLATTGHAFHRPPPPPPAPPVWAPVSTPTPIAARTLHAQKVCPPQRGVPADVHAANDAFLSRAKDAQRRRSLLDAGASDMCDSVRRQYYCLPSAEDTTIPTFAHRAGDLHVKPSSSSSQESPAPSVGPVVPSSSPPAALPVSGASPFSGRDKTSSAVREDYFSDAASPTTRDTSQTPARSPGSERFILPDVSDAETETEGSAAPIEPLMLDAVRAFNERFKKYQS